MPVPSEPATVLPDLISKAPGFQQIEVAVSGGMRERGIASDVGLIEQPPRAVSGQRHHALKIRQAGNRAQLAEVPLQVGLDIGGKEAVKRQKCVFSLLPFGRAEGGSSR